MKKTERDIEADEKMLKSFVSQLQKVSIKLFAQR